MANAIYPKWKEALMSGAANSALSSGTVKCALIDTAVRGYNAADDFFDDMSAAVVGTPSPTSGMTTKSVTNGEFDADPVTFTSVTGASVEAVLIYIDTGTPGTSRLVAYLDTDVGGLPVTPNGGDIIVTWDDSPNYIFFL
jgi:hypothetical protein